MLPGVSVEVAEIAVEEDNLEEVAEEDEDAARVVRLLAGDDARASINRAMVRAMLLLLPPQFIEDVQQRRVLEDIFLLIILFVIL